MLSLASIVTSRLLPFAIVALVAAFGTGWLTWKVADARYQKMLAGYAEAARKATETALAQERANAQIALEEANRQAAEQARLVAEARETQTEIVRYVNVPVTKVISQSCIPYGLIRVLSDSASGSGALRMSLPSGKSDDSCAPVDWKSFAGWIANNNSIARSNAAQLNGWVEWWNRVKPVPVKK